jgi:hypothetical protein
MKRRFQFQIYTEYAEGYIRGNRLEPNTHPLGAFFPFLTAVLVLFLLPVTTGPAARARVLCASPPGSLLSSSFSSTFSLSPTRVFPRWRAFASLAEYRLTHHHAFQPCHITLLGGNLKVPVDDPVGPLAAVTGFLREGLKVRNLRNRQQDSRS